MSFLESLAGNAAIAGGNILGDQIKNDAELERQQTMAKLNKELEMQKQEAILKLQDDYQTNREIRTNDLKNAPMTAFGKYAAAHANDMVDAPVTEVTGTKPGSSVLGADGKPLQHFGGEDVGLKGNYSELRARIAGDQEMSDEDKVGALNQLDAQFREQKSNPNKIKISQSGIVDAALRDALAAGDGTAYEAGLRLKNSDAKAENLQGRLDAQLAIAADTNRSYEERTKANERVAELRIEMEKTRTELKVAAAAHPEKVMSFIDSQRKEIEAASADLRLKMKAEMDANKFDSKKKAAIEAAYAPQFKELEKQRKQLNEDFASLRSQFKLPPIGGAAPAPDAPKTGRPDLSKFD